MVMMSLGTKFCGNVVMFLWGVRMTCCFTIYNKFFEPTTTYIISLARA